MAAFLMRHNQMSDGWPFFVVTYVFITTISCGSSYKYRYIESPNICVPGSSGLLSRLNKRKLEMSEYDADYGLVVKMSRYDTPIPRGLFNLKCRFEVEAPKSFGLLVVIQNMNLRIHNSTKECIDYVQFSQDDGRQSSPMCGVRTSHSPLQNSLVVPSSYLLENSFYDPEGEIDIKLSMGPFAFGGGDKVDLHLVFTAYRGCTSYGLFKIWQPCHGLSNICIQDSQVCDGIVNCGLGNITDESGCPPKEVTGVSTLPPFAYVLIAVSIAIVLTLLFGALRFCRTRKTFCWSQPRSNTPSRQVATTTSRRRQSSLEMVPPVPPHSQSHPPARIYAPSAPTIPSTTVQKVEEDLPPSYDELFPPEGSSVVGK